MACNPPAGRSVGFLFLDYIHVTANLPHRTHVRLNSTADPLDPITMFTEANLWGALLSDCQTGAFNVTGWGTQNPAGVGLLQAAFASPFSGNHAVAAGAEDYQARTVTFTGRGIPGSGNACKGPALTRMFIGNTFNFVPGQRFIARGDDAALDDLADFLEGNSVIWFDFYGQKATMRSLYPTHFHAYIQDRYGQ